jgi:hypothetical protein
MPHWRPRRAMTWQMPLAVLRPRPLATGAAAKAAGDLHQVVIRALADHGVHGPRGGRMRPAAVTSFSSVPAAYGTHGGPIGAMSAGLVT